MLYQPFLASLPNWAKRPNGSEQCPAGMSPQFLAESQIAGIAYARHYIGA